MDNTINDNQAPPVKPSKKEISKTVFEKLANSMAEFNLTGKKFESRLRRVSKLFAADIIRANRKKEKLEKKEKSKAKKVEAASN